MNKKPLAQAVSLAAISLGFSGALTAQQASQPTPSDDMVMEEVVTTGTPGGASIRKLDASFSITTLSDDEIALIGRWVDEGAPMGDPSEAGDVMSMADVVTREPVEAPDGTTACPRAPPATSTSQATVGVPRESSASQARTPVIAVSLTAPPRSRTRRPRAKRAGS